MSSLNLGVFTGRLGHTPELRDAGGTPVVNVSICVNVWAKGGEVPMWVPCVFWGRVAEILAEYRGKGDEVLVKGEFEPHEWTGKDGTTRKELRLVMRGPGGLTLTSGRSRANEDKGGELSEDATELERRRTAEPAGGAPDERGEVGGDDSPCPF